MRTLRAPASRAFCSNSKRGGGSVAVSGTRARFVTKARGQRPGTACIRKEQIFKVKPKLP